MSDSEEHLVTATAEAARATLARNCTAKGLSAAAEQYPQVWTRDTVLTFLGASIDGDPQMLKVFAQSLDILGSAQNRFGQVPYLVALADDKAAFGGSDSDQWWVIGCCRYAALSGDRAWLAGHADAIVRACDHVESRDQDDSGLMHSCECEDWADLIANRGKVLFPNVLACCALRLAAAELAGIRPAEAQRLAARAARVHEAIQQVFWVADPAACEDRSHGRARLHAAVTLRQRRFFLPWVWLFDYADRFDAAGNLLAILGDVATPEQAGQILDYIHGAGIDRPFPVRVLYPPIRPGDPDWREYYRVWNLNLPDHYHNGGIWPWVGGAYVAALVRCGRREEAQRQLVALAKSLNQGSSPGECNEWLHGVSGEAMGAKHQAWSAGMFLYAVQAVRTGCTPGLAADG